MKRSTLALIVVLTTLGLLGLMAGPAAAVRRDRAAVTDPRIALIGQSKWVPAHADFLIGVRITGAPAEGNIRVSVHRAVTSRAALQDTVSSNDAGRELFNLNLFPVKDQPIGPNGTRDMSVLIPTDQSSTTAQTNETGVYPVQVRVLTRDGTILARLTTFLVRMPDNALATNRLRAALVLKLHDPPTLTSNASVKVTRSGQQNMRTLVDALQTHPDIPATLVPTPQSLEALRDAKSDADTALLDDVIRIGQSDRQVLSSTYVRLDASAWLASGLGQELTHQQLVGTAVLASMLPKADHRTWIADADITPATLRHLRDAGLEQLVVPERSLAQLDTAKFPESPTEPFKVDTDTGFPTPAVQIDSHLQSAFSRTSDPGLGANQLLAELALISFEQKGAPGGVVLAPPDNWEASPTFLKVLLDGLGPDNPVVVPTTVDHLFAQVPPAGSNGSAAQRDGASRGFDLVRTLAPQATPSLGDFPAKMTQARMHLASYTSMVGVNSRRWGPFDHRLLLAGSADLSRRDQDGTVASTDAALTRQFNSIVAPSTEKVTLTSRNADFPLTLQSRLGYPVDVVIDLQASNRLTFPGGNRIQKRLEGQRTPVKLRVRAPVSGDTPVQVTVRSPDGNVVLATSRYTVRVTAVSGVGVVLTSGAALFLVIWWVRHWRSSARLRNGSAAS